MTAGRRTSLGVDRPPKVKPKTEACRYPDCGMQTWHKCKRCGAIRCVDHLTISADLCENCTGSRY